MSEHVEKQNNTERQHAESAVQKIKGTIAKSRTELSVPLRETTIRVVNCDNGYVVCGFGTTVVFQEKAGTLATERIGRFIARGLLGNDPLDDPEIFNP